MPLIEYRDVTVMRGGTVALDSLTLSIGEGEHVAVIGPNGSGKSTLVKTITRECYPQQRGPGSWLRILERDTWNVFDLRCLLGIVSNDLLQTCTQPYSGLEIVLSGFFSSVGIWPNHHVTQEMRDKAGEVLRRLEISHLAKRRMTEMSSGEARRILIARALVHDPTALVLDEPTNSLDLRAQRELREMLRNISRAGTSLIMVTHHLPDIIPEIERVILLKDGRVFSDGPKRQVLDAAVLSSLFDMPLELITRDGYYHLL